MMTELLKKAKKQTIPGFTTNDEIASWVVTLDKTLQTKIKKAMKVKEILECLKWGVIGKIEAEQKLKEI